MPTIDRRRLAALMEREQKKFVDERPKSQALFEAQEVAPRWRSHELDGQVGLRLSLPSFAKHRARISMTWTVTATSTFVSATLVP